MATASISGETWGTLTPTEKLAAWRQVSPEDRIAARDTFRQRCNTNTLSPAIANVGRIKTLNATGDVEVLYPQVDVTHLPLLESDELMAVVAAEMVIREAREQHLRIAEITPGSGKGTPLPDIFNPATASEVIAILNPLAGG